MVVVVETADPIRQRSVLAIVATEAALGRPVTVLAEGAALVALARGGWAERVGPVEGPAALLRAARSTGTCRLVACPTAVEAVGLTVEAVRPHVDAVLGLPELLGPGGEALLFA
ncbi:MAG: hypothetical protein D6729_02940 [Deltaproteobacteria bacterium]|nr:MAG: hypothetical protein D6729_02940 [Deltaproteobacteria bacterium]